MMTTGFQQIERADNIRLNEIAGAANRSIHMRLRGEMQHLSNLAFLHHAKHSAFVAQIDFFESVLGMVLYPFEICEMPGVREAIQIHQHFDLGPIDDVQNQVRTDKPCPACNQ
jgi:hypothetical protein